jgi:hypothetical protein
MGIFTSQRRLNIDELRCYVPKAVSSFSMIGRKKLNHFKLFYLHLEIKSAIINHRCKYHSMKRTACLVDAENIQKVDATLAVINLKEALFSQRNGF